MTFNPKESIDFNGNTGPFIQYTHARIKSILRKASENNIGSNSKLDYNTALETKETSLIKLLYEYPSVTIQASENMSPALVANYAYELAKEFNQFYHDISILKESDEEKRDFRISLSAFVARTLKSAMALLGIQVPERM